MNSNSETKENVGRKFAKYVSLNIIGMITASAMVFIDAIFISIALGADGLAAISLAAPIWGTIFGLGLLLGEGGGSKYAANMATNKEEKANAFFTIAVKGCLIMSIPLLILGIFFSEQIASLLGARDSILPLVSGYTMVFLIFSPFTMLYYALESLVRNDETPGVAMISAVILYTMNIILDYFFILHLELGMVGSALATSISAILALLYLLYHWKLKARFRFATVFARTKKTKAIFAIGAPSFATNVLGGVNTLVFNLLFLRYLYNIGVAAFGIVSTLSILVFAVFLGIAQGMQPMVSHYYGKADFKNLNKVLRLSIITSVVVALICIAAIFIFTQELTGIFNQEYDPAIYTQLAQLANNGARIYFSAFVFVGFTIVSTYFLAATGSPKRALFLSVLQSGGIIPFVILSSSLAGVTGIWASYPIFEFILGIISILFLVQNNRRLGSHFKKI